MKPDQVAALENELRAKGSSEDALVRYETALQQMADDVTALVPGLTWHWNRERWICVLFRAAHGNAWGAGSDPPHRFRRPNPG